MQAQLQALPFARPYAFSRENSARQTPAWFGFAWGSGSLVPHPAKLGVGHHAPLRPLTHSAQKGLSPRLYVRLFNAFILFCALNFVICYYTFAFDEKDWNVEKSTHFIVYYKDAAENFVNQVVEKAEECYKSISENLGFTRYNFWLWDNRAKIYIYNNAQDYQEKTGKPSWSGGVAYYHEKVIETYPWAGGFFQFLLPHELGHIIFREFVGAQSNAPVWLDEGVAMFQEKSKRTDLKKKLLQALEEKKLIPLDKLSQLNVAFVNDKEIVELYYLESLSVVSYLMERFGKDNFVELCHALKERKSFDEAINDAYRVFKNLEELDKAWLRHIKE